ncbi:MAG: exodeoxyribonuclease VII large subunit [Acidimicrobiia bacterium]
MDLENYIEHTEISLELSASSPQTYSVKEINEAISSCISKSFPSDVWVRGEVQRLRFHSSGHVYFDLVETGTNGKSSCSIPVTLLSWNARNIKANLREVLVEDREVRILCRPDFYAPYGRMSLAASDVDTAFVLGQIALARRELIEKLTKEQIIENNKNVFFEELICNIALVTSVESAAYHDVIDQLKASGYGFKIFVVNALMQGHGSVESVVSSLKAADKLDVDVVLLCRGGGSKTDLVTFDSEAVARHITKMKKPVLCGLGHQIDISVADMVCALALKTPTACAQFLIERTKSAIDSAKLHVQNIEQSCNDILRTYETRQANLARKILDTSYVLDKSKDKLDSIDSNLKAIFVRAIKISKDKVRNYKALINAHDPMRVLERGYSLTLNENGQVIKKVSDVAKDELVYTKLVDGELTSKISHIQKRKK